MLAALKNGLRRLITRGRGLVLAYHSIHERPPPFEVWHHLHLDQFEAQIAYLARHHDCLTVPEFLAETTRGGRRAHPAAVTFDDGFANNLHLALPVLAHYRVPATFFITTGALGGPWPLWPDGVALLLARATVATLTWQGKHMPVATPAERTACYRVLVRTGKQLPAERRAGFLTEIAHAAGLDPAELGRDNATWSPLAWHELATLAASPWVTIGAHTVSHPMLSALAPEAARAEIFGSRAALAAHGIDAGYFAYPYGGSADFDDTHRQMAIDAGFAAAFVADAGAVTAATDRFRVPRLGIGSDCSLAGFRYLVSGGALSS